MRQLGIVGALLAAAFIGCGDSDGGSSTRTCASNETPGTVSVFAPAVGASEGIAFLAGELYIAGSPGVRRIAADGTATMIAEVPGSVGMAAWQGALYVAGQDEGGTPAFCAPTNHGVIWRVTADGQKSVFASGFISPNFIVATPWNTLLVSDDCINNRNIYEVDEQGSVTVWDNTIASANGMAFDPTASNLLVVNTFVRTPLLQQIAIAADHSSAATTSVHSFAMGTTPDGLALDDAGNAYVALNIIGEIHRVSPDGTATPFASGMTSPASLAFGDGPDFDPCSMYVTSLTGEDVYRVAVGGLGLPLAQ